MKISIYTYGIVVLFVYIWLTKTTQMNILIVDAANERIEALQKTLINLGQDLGEIHQANDLERGCEILASCSINTVFIEIGLSSKFDFRVLRKYKQANLHIVFLLQSSKQATDVLLENDMLYLTHPIDQHALLDVLLTIQARLLTEHFTQDASFIEKVNRIELKDKNGIRFIDIKQINHCTSDNNYTEIFLENGERFVSPKTLKEHSSLLEPHGFFRVHQSHLVDLKRIRRVINKNGLFVGLENGTVVELSRRRKEKLMKKLRGLHH